MTGPRVAVASISAFPRTLPLGKQIRPSESMIRIANLVNSPQSWRWTAAAEPNKPAFKLTWAPHMLGIHEIWLFILSGILLNITPGRNSVYVIGRSMQMGWRGGAAAALGISFGCLFHVCGAAIGLSALLMASSTAFSILKLVGAAYLVVTDFRCCCRARRWPQPSTSRSETSLRGSSSRASSPTRSIPRSRCSSWPSCRNSSPPIRPQAARLPDARPDLHLYGHVLVLRRRGVRGKGGPPAAQV